MRHIGEWDEIRTHVYGGCSSAPLPAWILTLLAGVEGYAPSTRDLESRIFLIKLNPYMAAPPRFELGITESKSVALPLGYRAIFSLSQLRLKEYKVLLKKVIICFIYKYYNIIFLKCLYFWLLTSNSILQQNNYIH